MRRWMPFPLMSAALLILWLLLNQTLSPGHILLGGVVALIGGWALTLLGLPNFRVLRPAALIRLSAAVLADIIRSNIAVDSIILGLRARERRSGFVDIP